MIARLLIALVMLASVLMAAIGSRPPQPSGQSVDRAHKSDRLDYHPRPPVETRVA